ncbi:hypothetical protein ABT025_31680 [Streptomyces sp. NPDC002809]|uniref:hypothetical protein n=1 Tax=Streptomyces sp. NPDC002809 TaxID=3154433 RepID=UPI003326AFEA
MTTASSLQLPVAGPLRHGQLGLSMRAAETIPLGALLLAAGAAVFVLLLRYGWLRRRSTVIGVTAAVVAGVVLLGMTVTGKDGREQAATTPGVPLVQQVELSGKRVPVVVVPNRPGFNLVGIGEAQASAGLSPGALTAGTLRPGSSRSWVGVELPEGATTLYVSAGARNGSLEVDTGSRAGGPAAALRGADGPECAGAAVGAVLAGRDEPLEACPADRLTAQDASALRAIVHFLAERGEPAIALVEDGSARSRSAAAQVRAAAARKKMKVTAPGRTRRPVVIVSGWTGAETVLRAVGDAATVARGTYLAPWLLSPDLLTSSAGQVVALRYAPRDAAPNAYLAALSRRLPGELPSAAGYEAWAAERGEEPGALVRLFAASEVNVPGMPAHEHKGAEWLPGGMIIPVSAPLRL